MFDPSHCGKTCDNCLKELRWIEKDVTNIARQLVWQLCPSSQTNVHTSHCMNLHFASLGRAGQDDKAIIFFFSHSWSLQRLCKPKCMNSAHYSSLFTSKVYFVITLPPGTANTVRLYHYAHGPDCASWLLLEKSWWHGKHMLTPGFWSMSIIHIGQEASSWYFESSWSWEASPKRRGCQNITAFSNWENTYWGCQKER